MKTESINTRRRKFPLIVAGATVALSPILFPKWVSVIAEAYISNNATAALDAMINTCSTNDNGESDNPNNQAFQRDCNLITDEGLTDDPSGTIDAMNRIAADQIAAQNNAALRHMRTVESAISARMHRLRSEHQAAAGKPDVFSYNFSRDKGSGAGDAEFGRLGGFFNLRYRTGDEDNTANQAGYDFDGWGLTAGLDYRVTDDFFAGAALSYLSDDIDYDNNRGSMDVDLWGISAYGSYYLDNGLYLNGLVGYNPTDYDLDRRIEYNIAGVASNQTATSNPDGDLFNLSLGGGYPINYNHVDVTPTVRLEYVRNDVDGFTETMTNIEEIGGALAQSVDSNTYNSLTSHLGVQFSKAVSTSYGVLVPLARIDWIHEFENDQQKIRTSYANDINAPTNNFLITNNSPDRNYYNLNLALSAQLARGRAGFISYDALLGLDNVSYHSFIAGFRTEF